LTGSRPGEYKVRRRRELMTTTKRTRIELSDDGTMDTVLRCSECSAEFRGNYDRMEDLERDDTGKYIVGNCRYQTEEQASQADYDLFVEDFIEEVEDEHVCHEDADGE
jgi:hypothetical protein